jgi:dipeptidase
MHAGSLMGTTASMVARLPDGGEPPVAWVALGAPCVSVYLPYYLDGPIPAAVGAGGRDPSPAAAWWRFHALRARVEAEPERLASLVRAYWDGLESEIADRARQVEARAADLRARGDAEGVGRLLGEFMATNVNAMLRGLDELDDVSRRGRSSATAP